MVGLEKERLAVDPPHGCVNKGVEIWFKQSKVLEEVIFPLFPCRWSLHSHVMNLSADSDRVLESHTSLAEISRTPASQKNSFPSSFSCWNLLLFSCSHDSREY